MWWAEGMKALGRPEFTTNQIIGFNTIGLAAGIFTLWLYATIRPRYGAGPVPGELLIKPKKQHSSSSVSMRDLIVVFLHAVVTICRVIRPGGVRSVIAESVLLKHQLLILNWSRRRAPNLGIWDRVIAGFCSLFVKPVRLARVAIALKPSTLLNFHRALVRRKYQLLFSPKRRTKPGPKGPDASFAP